MKNVVKYLIIVLVLAGLGFAGYFFYTSNKKDATVYETATAFITSIEKKTVATGKVVPEDEVEIKPQISGIIQKVYVKEGDKVKVGSLIAKVKVIPSESALNSAKGRVKTAKGRLSVTKISLANAKLEYDRNKKLLDKGIIPTKTFTDVELAHTQAKQNVTNAQYDLDNAKSDLQIIRIGTAGGGATNTNIRATIAGTILEIPVKKGDQVIESNNFNPGTTVAMIADLSTMIFEGKIDEAEVGKLIIGMPLTITLGAIDKAEFDAKLRFISPKGTEESGAVQFKIEGDVELSDSVFIRAGYSANASMVLDKRTDVLAIKESLLLFDKETDEPYVELEGEEEQVFERKDIKLGLSDGINVEILEGITKDDKIKVWNKTEPKKKKTDKDKK